MLYTKINVKSDHFLFLTSCESPLNKGGSEGVWKCRWLPCFPGSSGSPVLLCNIGSIKNKYGGFQFGANRVYLLGVLYGGPQLTVEGDIRVKTIPDAQQKPYSVSAIPNNLGYILKSERIIELNDFILSQLNLHGHK